MPSAYPQLEANHGSGLTVSFRSRSSGLARHQRRTSVTLLRSWAVLLFGVLAVLTIIQQVGRFGG
jgi:hypothetical protein